MAEAQAKDTDRKSGGSSGNGKYKSTGRRVLGKTEELGELVYKIGTADQADLFIRTTEAIADYVGKEYGWELRILVKYRKEAAFTKPKYPTRGAAVQTRSKEGETLALEPVDNAQVIEYKAELEIYHRKHQVYLADKAKVFVTILGQCTVGVKGWLENGNGLTQLETDCDVIGLLNKLEEMAFSTGGDLDPFLFETAAKVLTGHWGEFYPTKLVKNGLTKEQTKDRFLARILLMGADKGRFGTLLDELQNNYIGGTDRYPKTLEDTLRLLSKYQGHGNKNPGKTSDDNSEAMVTSFAQQGKQKGSPYKNNNNRNSDDEKEEKAKQGDTNRKSRSPSRSRGEGWNS
jgi:hypothetical protein